MYISLNKRFLNPWFLDSLNPVSMKFFSTFVFASFIRFPSITKYKLQCNCCYSFLCSFLLDLASCSLDTCFIFCKFSRWYAMFTSIIVFFNIPLLIWVYVVIWHTSVSVTSKSIVITINRSKWNKTPVKILWIWNDIIETPPPPNIRPIEDEMNTRRPLTCVCEIILPFWLPKIFETSFCTTRLQGVHRIL